MRWSMFWVWTVQTNIMTRFRTLWHFRYIVVQCVWTNNVQVLRERVQRELKAWKTTSEWNANWSSAIRSLLWWSILRGCNDVTSASSSSKNFVVPSVRRCTQTISGGEDSATRGCSRNWSDVSCTLVSTRVASTQVTTNDLLSDERSMSRSRVVCWQVRW